MKYAVSVVMRSEHEGESDPICEFVVLYIEAASNDDALRRAELVGKRREQSYSAADGRPVAWKFLRVDEAQLLNEDPNDGAELFSKFLRESELGLLFEPIE